MKMIPYGESHFETIRNDGFLYVDKTQFIRQLEQTRRIIHLRPRRFGKSLFISMLECYYDVNRADQFDDLFEGLSIKENPTDNRNNYYILRFNFSGIQTTSIETINSGFFVAVKSALEIFVSKYQFKIEFEKTHLASELLRQLLTELEKLKLQHKVYVLIDEYDHFTNAVLNEGLEGFMTLVTRGGMVRSFYEVIKLNCEQGIVERFFMTGVMSISLDSMTSGFNIGTNMSTDERFAHMMGFTSEEVKDLLKTPMKNSDEQQVVLTPSERDDVYDIWRENYNGYLFSEASSTKVFNATLIMYYLQRYIEGKKHPRRLIDPNLNQSGTTIKNLAELKNREANYQVVEEIVKERTISGNLSPFMDVDKKYDENDFMTALFSIGFLTIKEGATSTKFKMPNKIIEAIYVNYLSELTQKRVGYKLDTRAQGLAIDEMGEDGRIDQLNQLVSNFLAHLSGRNEIKFDEKYIQLLYLFILTSTDQYVIYDEFPALRGYSDVVALKTPGSYAKYEYLIELKYVKKGSKSEAIQARVDQKFSEGVAQVTAYMKDQRLRNRCELKKFVVVFVGPKVAKMEEI
ncbi:MAG: ATP-binding protein [Defluviitaleaceae bacterium]|nr:ATP-binding protein [Defluviitaleaceae bacterium]